MAEQSSQSAGDEMPCSLPIKRRRWRRMAWALVVLLSVVVIAIGYARVRFHGEELAALVSEQASANLRGTFEARSVEWSITSVPTALVGGWVPVTIHDLTIYDEFGDAVVKAPLVTAEVDAGGFFSQRLAFRNISVAPGGYGLIKAVPEPSPRHEFDRRVPSLLLALRPHSAPAFAAGYHPRAGIELDLESYSVTGGTVEFEFPGFRAIAEEAESTGFLRMDGRDPLAPRLSYSLAPTARRGAILEPFHLDLVDIDISRLAQLPIAWPRENIPRDVEYEARAATPSGTRLHGRGKILDFWVDPFQGEHDALVDIENAGAFTRALGFASVGGDDLAVRARILGPVIAPRIEVELENGTVELPRIGDGPPPTFSFDRLAANYDFITDTGQLAPSVARGAGGAVRVAGRIDTEPLEATVAVEVVEALDLGPWLAPEIVDLAGGSEVSGSLTARATRGKQFLDPLDVRLGNTRLTGRLIHEDGEGTVRADGVTVRRGATRIQNIHGSLDVVSRRFDVDFGLLSTNLAPWLATLGAPRIATGITGRGHATGTLDDIQAAQASGGFTLLGVPVLNRVTAEISYADGTVRVVDAQSSVLDGWLAGTATIRLFHRPHIDADLRAMHLDLSKMPGIGSYLVGRSNVELRAEGPLNAPVTTMRGDVSGWAIDGDPYKDAEFTITRAADGAVNAKTRVERLRGGELALDAGLTVDGNLRGRVQLANLPLESALTLAGAHSVPAGGMINADIELNGTPDAPTSDGLVSVVEFWFEQTFFGTAGLEIERQGDGLLHVGGSLYQGKVEVDGTVQTTLPLAVDLRLVLRRTELDLLFPEESKELGARGWVSGEVRLQAEILGNQAPQLTASLSEAVVLVDTEDASGQPAPMRFHNRSPVRLTYDGSTLEFTDPAVVASPAGDFEVWGKGAPEALDFYARGRVALRSLKRYLRSYVECRDAESLAGPTRSAPECLQGHILLDAHLGGTLADRVYTGVAEFEKVTVRRPGGKDATLMVPTGKIEVTNEQLALTGIKLIVEEDDTRERSTLSIAGGIRLEDLDPRSWAVRIDGELAGTLLLLAFPESFSSASGSADISVSLGGTGPVPSLDGSIDFRPENALKLTPRGARRELALTSGSIRGTDQLIEFEDVGGWIDDEGQLSALNGTIELAKRAPRTLEEFLHWELDRVALRIAARDVPLRIPGELELSLSVPNLSFSGSNEQGYAFQGRAEIVDGRYIRRWRPVLDALRPVRSTETSPPFYAEIPWLAEARLEIVLETRGFFVRNNMFNLELSSSLLRLTGTPKSPKLDGVVRVEQGSFKFTGIRANFSRTSGEITFSSLNKELGEDTPDLNITSESDYQDINGQNHLVTMTLVGPFAQPVWDLSTNTGLNKGQTLTLIFAGRTPEEARRALGDEGVATRTGTLEISTADSTALITTDELVKDLAGDFFSLLIEDPIRNFTTLDYFRLEVGTASVGAKAGKSFTKSINALMEVDRSLRGWSWDLRGEYRLTDSVSVNGEILKKNFDDEAEEDETNLRAKFTWRKILLP